MAGEWRTEPCSNGGLLLIRGERGQSLQVLPAEDALLMAAAPELLEACRRVREYGGYWRLPCSVQQLIESAIAKAEGGVNKP